MARPKGVAGPNKETIYVLGEVKHLAFCGMDPEFICQAVHKSASALSKLLYKYGEPELGQKFGALDQRTRRKDDE